MIVIKKRHLQVKSIITPNDFMVLMFGAAMDKLDSKALSKLTCIPLPEVEIALKRLKELGLVKDFRVISDNIGEITMTKEKPKTTRKKKAPSCFTECLDTYDKIFKSWAMVQGKTIVSLDWTNPRTRNALIHIIKKLKILFIKLNEKEDKATGVMIIKEADDKTVVKMLFNMLKWVIENDFWGDKLFPEHILNNFDKIALKKASEQ